MKKLLLVLISLLFIGCKSEVIERINREVDHSLDTPIELFEKVVGEDVNPLHERYSCKFISSYNFSNPVPKSDTVEDAYFTNVIMGGDSRMGSIALYSDIPDKGAEVYYVTSLSIWRVYDMKVDNGGDESIFDLLSKSKKKNIYFIIGINEINGMNMDVWRDELDLFIKDLRKANSSANIYMILGYYPRKMNNISTADLKAAVEEENNRIKEICKKHKIFFIDPNDSPLIADDGLLKDELTWDGVHFNEAGAQMFADFIKTHVYKEEKYVQEICE